MRLTEPQTEGYAYCINLIQMYNFSRLNSNITSTKTYNQNGFVLSGHAGTGKSKVIEKLITDLSASGIYGKVITFTGRAASHLAGNGVPNTGTAHALLMEPVLDEKGNLKYFAKRSLSAVYEAVGGFLLVEEAGMMPWSLIESFLTLNIPVIFVGDDEQLEAINDENVFSMPVAESWGGFFLSDILRTAEDSPIDYLAKNIRENNLLALPNGVVPGDTIKFGKLSTAFTGFIRNHCREFDAIICGTNKTRKKINSHVRFAMGYNDEIPGVGEKLICLKNTVKSNQNINNGELFEVVGVYKSSKKNCHKYSIKKMEGISKYTITVDVDDEMFSSENRIEDNKSDRELCDFTFGYGISCHKVQGSSIENVLFLDENVSFFLNQKKFRYTAVTRASKHITILK